MGEPVDHAIKSASRKRWGYGASIPQFLADDPRLIIGALASWSSFADETTQKAAWLEQISILKKLLTPYAAANGALFFEYDIPRLGLRVDTALLLEHVLFVLEFKVGARDYTRDAIDQVWDYALDLKNFHEASHRIPIVPILVATKAGATTLRIEIGDLSGVWVPDVGAVRDFTFDGPRASELARTTHFNDATGTAVAPAGRATGDAYTIDTLIPDLPSDTALADVPFAALKMPKQTGIPEKIADIASKATASADTPIERARALESYLHTQGFFSHGLGDGVVSLSGHGANRITSLFGGDQMVGDDEQYAVAMALMATQLGMPARVVMGWHADEKHPQDGPTLTATGGNLHAWVEIAFQGYGWVPFDPTPDEDNKPNDQSTKPKANPKPQVLQPPPPAQQPADLPPAIAENRDQDEEQAADLSWLGPVLLYGGLTLGILLLLAAPFIVMGVIKGVRRARRRNAERTADRISGGWDELVDSAVDLRAPVAIGATRAESALVVGSTFDDPRVTQLATRADVDVFGPGDPAPEDVDAFWREVDEIVGQMRGSTTVWQRLRARLSVRSLRRSGWSWHAVGQAIAGTGRAVVARVRRGIRPRGTESSDD